ncbi:MAG: ribosomal L7Ae/L30e/S12e/Gadd45 family protein [Oscillospiraceae bacterium]|nr:ribosomal L7Ae/L30e/S12e/Gadd45 family protein [Oscillospiraceae bacterium]
MSAELAASPKVVGAKQVRRALNGGTATRLYVAQDADPALLQPLVQLAGERGVPVEQVSTMKQLGTDCGIAVGAAVAALISVLAE